MVPSWGEGSPAVETVRVVHLDVPGGVGRDEPLHTLAPGQTGPGKQVSGHFERISHQVLVPDISHFLLSVQSHQSLIAVVRLCEVSTEMTDIATVGMKVAPTEPTPALEGGPGVSHQQDHLVGQAPAEDHLRVVHGQSDNLESQDREQGTEEFQKPRGPTVQCSAPAPKFRVSRKSDIVTLFVVKVGTHILEITV